MDAGIEQTGERIIRHTIVRGQRVLHDTFRTALGLANNNYMYQFGKALQDNLLDLLIDGPSSFAALYGGLLRHCSYPPTLNIQEVADSLFEMEQLGLVQAHQMADDGTFHMPSAEERERNTVEYQAWLPTASFNDLSIDEVGLWYELSQEGRDRWKQWLDTEDQHESTLWQLDDLSDTQTLVIHAQDLDVASEGTRWWLSRNTDIELIPNSESIQTVPDFTLHNGAIIRNGVKLLYRYKKLNLPSH